MVTNISKASSFIVKNICDTDIKGMMISREKRKGLWQKITRTSNAVTTFSLNGQVAQFEDKKIFSIVDHALKVQNRKEWFKEETTNLFSAEINKVIDTACKKYGPIRDTDRKNIFRKLSSEVDATLDQVCTQSSISHMLYNSQAVSKEVQKLYHPSHTRDEKNKINNLVNKKLTDIVYIKKFSGKAPDPVRTRAAEEMALLVKKKKLSYP